MEVTRTRSGAVIVNDTYNANPVSMRAALDALLAMDGARRIAVLGAMAELADPAAGHRQVMADAIERGIEVIAVGTDLYGIRHVDDPVAALGEIGDGDVVLVKASRSAGMERWIEPLLGR
jgi:UDP-N-acetylmuramoyl-tripeptide--D-alanyl-D-alanine ligase